MISLVEFYGENLATINQVEFKLQTCRPVCMSFTLEGHGEHYTHPQQRQPKLISRRMLLGMLLDYAYCPILLHRGSQDDAIPTCYTKAALSCYVEQKYFTDAPVHYTTTYAAPSYYTYVPKYYCASKESRKKEVVSELQCPICHQLRSSSCNLFAIMVWRCSPVDVVSDVSLVWWKPNCNAAAFFYTTYATTNSCTEVFKCYTTKAPEFYTTTYAAPRLYYTDALKYYSAPSYYTTKATEQDHACCPILPHQGSQQYFSAPIFTTTTEAAKDDAVLTCYTKAALSCYVELKYYTDAAV
ncbi:hypothetical protein DAPPUDRAFT_240108 [Daphnia pulex]|uniref:Uncharacterized protein n=1 Tax=Daphnia pulex TaxID=6669 RepID=E9GAW5_DAPPU|nr:hypothetical protein DAPPUDRAFT_240108 [Daphnia pulex]|eukprot:EFX83473.1 hypothetical protein DAPPUDRAFT_240108 [Daphnia pulex]